MSQVRANTYAGTCDQCGTEVPAGAGRLVDSNAYATRRDRTARPAWKVRCVDGAACKSRIRQARADVEAAERADHAAEWAQAEAEASRKVAQIRERNPYIPALKGAAWLLPSGYKMTVRKERGSSTDFRVTEPQAYDGCHTIVHSRAEAELMCLTAWLDAEKAPLRRALDRLGQRTRHAASAALITAGDRFGGDDVVMLGSEAARHLQEAHVGGDVWSRLRGEGLDGYISAAATLNALAEEDIAEAVRCAAAELADRRG